MNKAELIKAIANKTNIIQADTERFLNAFIETVEETTAAGDSVKLVGFGTFSTVEKKKRKGTHPQTGEKITIPKHTVPKFSAGKAYREAVNTKAKGKRKKR